MVHKRAFVDGFSLHIFGLFGIYQDMPVVDRMSTEFSRLKLSIFELVYALANHPCGSGDASCHLGTKGKILWAF